MVTEYQENIEQGIVDSLFDYFGRVYYQSDVSTQDGKKVRNHYISKYDSRVLKMFAKRTNSLWFAFSILFILGLGGLLAILFGVGTSILNIMGNTKGWWQPEGMEPGLFWAIIFGILLGICGGMLLISVVLLVSVIYWMRLDKRFARHTREKIKEWNRVFERFSMSS